MKRDKKVLFALIFLFILTGFAGNASAQSSLEDSAQQLQGISQDLSSSTSPADYLKQEWTKILEKNDFGKVLLNISSFLTNFNPVFKLILGVEYSLSWAFIFAVVIWLSFFLFFFNLSRGIFEKHFFISLLLSFVVVCLIGISGAIREIVNLLSYLIKDPWIAVICFFLALLIMFLIIRFSGGLEEYIKKQKEQVEKMNLERDKKLIQASAEGIREGLKDKK